MAKEKKTPTDNQLEIKNFKSIQYAKIETSRINIFIGRPNSGKSNLLEALTLFNFIQTKTEKQTEPSIIRYKTLDNLFYDRNTANDIEIRYRKNIALLSYLEGVNTFFQIVNPPEEYARAKKAFLNEHFSLDNFNNKLDDFSNKIKLMPKQTNGGTYPFKTAVLDMLGSQGHFIRTLQTESAVRRYEFKDGITYNGTFYAYLTPSGDNLYAIVQGNPKIREWINSFFQEFNLEFLMDSFTRTFEIQKKEKGIVYKIPFELTPDTFRRMLFHVAAIYSNKNATILFEEPESHSFPPYIKELSELIKEDVNNNYFITTHSPYFFNSMVEDSEKIKDIAFFHVYYDDYQTKIKKLDQNDLDNVWGNSADVFFNIDSLSK